MPRYGLFKEKLRYSGGLRLTLDAFGRLGLRLTPYYLVAEGVFGAPLPELERGFEDYELRFLGPADMPAAAAVPGWELPEVEMQQRLREGQLCFGALHQGRVVAFNWINLAWCTSRMCRFPLEADEGYLFDAFTWTAYRGRGIAPYLRYQTYKVLARRGIRRLYSISDALNTPSIKFKKKLQARFIKFGVAITVGRRWEYNLTLRDASRSVRQAVGKQTPGAIPKRRPMGGADRP